MTIFLRILSVNALIVNKKVTKRIKYLAETLESLK